MGFGTLFVGYFFVLNFPYCEFTDALAAIIMLYGLYKLSGINESFRRACYFSVAFVAFGLLELGIELYGMLFFTETSPGLITVLSLLRHFIVGLTTAFMMLGIREVANEVGLGALKEKSTRGAYVSIGIYVISILLESASLAKFVDVKILAFASVFVILATFTVVIFNLVCIYSAYMRICMPDEKDMEEKESKFEFVNAFRRHEEEKSREYAEYRLEKLKKKQEKKAQRKEKK